MTYRSDWREAETVTERTGKETGRTNGFGWDESIHNILKLRSLGNQWVEILGMIFFSSENILEKALISQNLAEHALWTSEAAELQMLFSQLISCSPVDNWVIITSSASSYATFWEPVLKDEDDRGIPGVEDAGDEYGGVWTLPAVSTCC